MFGLFKKNRCTSPIPKLCLPRQKSTNSVEVYENKGLEVPLESRGRSSSFDSSSLHKETVEFLDVPKPGRRCHSFDSSTSPGGHWGTSSEESINSEKESGRKYSLKLPGYQRRRSSLEIPRLCIHCVHMEVYLERQKEKENNRHKKPDFYIDVGDDNSIYSSCSDSDDEALEEDDDALEEFSVSDFSDLSDYIDDDESDLENGGERNCDMIINDKPHRVEYTEGKLNKKNLEKSKSLTLRNNLSVNIDTSKCHGIQDSDNCDNPQYTNAVTLEVPVIKQHRSASLDTSVFKQSESEIIRLKSPTRVLVQRQASFDEDNTDVSKQIRSTSVDVSLPTEKDAHYNATVTNNNR